MGLSGEVLQIAVIIIFATVACEAATMVAKPGCPDKCGNVEIPFPFGLAEGCFLDHDPTFHITCDHYSGQPKTGTVPITSISIENHELHVLQWVAQDCYYSIDPYNRSATLCPSFEGPVIYRTNNPNSPVGLSRLNCKNFVNNGSTFWVDGQFTISNSKNKFIVLGCDTTAYLRGYQNGEAYSLGCSSQCPSLDNVVNGSCSGVGCCEVGFPDGLKNITMDVQSFNNHSQVLNFNPCGYAFVVEKSKFNFSVDYLKKLTETMFPLVLDWVVSNQTCEKAKKKKNFACKENSECVDLKNTRQQQGYRCKCKQGYQGNPYVHKGCQDIDECQNQTLNNCTNTCINTIGSYNCGCPKWYHGDGRKGSKGCSADISLETKIFIGIGTSLIAMLGGGSWLYLALQKRKYIKLKAELFQQNGGLILQRRLRELGSTKKAKIFTFEELKKATKNYKESRIIGRGGFGTVYKGFLQDNTIVAIKKSKTVDQNQVDQFINEIVLLSQIDHKNVVKLLGCCLETQVPLLVYEFVPKGTLFNYIHHESSASTKHWETCLRIAVETADALSYLHSTASPPIIHRDVKPSNILLDDNFTAKVSDFGISKLVPRDKKDLTTVVQGTFGYLDPEYLQTNQLTEKSDIYSFGVVLVELLTGEDVISFDRSEDERCLPMYFLSSLKDDRLFEILENFIVEEGNKEHINEVVELIERCLRLKGNERPSMKEVAMELDRIRKIETHSWIIAQSNLEEAEHLLGKTSDAYKYGGTSRTAAGYESMKDHVTLALGDGR